MTDTAPTPTPVDEPEWVIINNQILRELLDAATADETLSPEVALPILKLINGRSGNMPAWETRILDTLKAAAPDHQISAPEHLYDLVDELYPGLDHLLRETLEQMIRDGKIEADSHEGTGVDALDGYSPTIMLPADTAGTGQ